MSVVQNDIFGATAPVLVSARRLAELLRVTAQTVYNYRTRGMPVTVRDGRVQFDVARCRAWVGANQAEFLSKGAKGGRRPGAGRKGTTAVQAAHAMVNAAGTAQLPEIKTMAEPGSGTGGGGGGGKAPIFNSADELMKLAGSEEMTGARARQVRDTVAAVERMYEIEKRMGTVLAREDVEEAHAEHMRTLRDRLEALPLRAGTRIAGALALDRARSETTRQIINECVREIFELMARDPMGESDDAGESPSSDEPKEAADEQQQESTAQAVEQEGTEHDDDRTALA